MESYMYVISVYTPNEPIYPSQMMNYRPIAVYINYTTAYNVALTIANRIAQKYNYDIDVDTSNDGAEIYITSINQETFMIISVTKTIRTPPEDFPILYSQRF